MAAIFCSAILIPSEATISTDAVVYKTTAIVQCNPGFMFPDGRIHIAVLCNQSALWNDTAPHCQGVKELFFTNYEDISKY